MHTSRPHLGTTRYAVPLLATATLLIDDAVAYAAQREREQKAEGAVDPEATVSKTVRGGVNPGPAREYDPEPIACRDDWQPEEPLWKREQRTKHRSAFRRR